jgi:Xaa-Pro aminopeptidase
MKRIEEIALKESRVKNFMQKNSLQGVLLKTQANFCWFTGGGLNEVTVADTLGVTSILVTVDDRYIISDNIEAPRMMEDEGFAKLGFKLVQFEWHSGSEAQEVAKIVDPKLVSCDTTGFEYQCFANEIKALRYTLLQPEIDRYLWLGHKASQAIESILALAKPGMRECMLTGEVLRVLWYDRIDSICNQSAADDRSMKYRHAIPTEKTIDKYLMLNVNARKWGLVTTITRIVYFGKVDEALRKQYNDNVYIECGMIAASEPGVTMSDIFKTTVDLYTERGYPNEWKFHHQGGAQGYRNRDYIIFPNSTETILENQCLCWNPTIAGNKYGTKSEDAFIATNNGPIMITGPVLFPTLSVSAGGIDFVRPDILEA